MNDRPRKVLLHLSLFVVTFLTTTIAGSSWSYGRLAMLGMFTWNPEFTFDDFMLGLPYSITFLSILTVHEFGHYFAAMFHRVRATLPYYLPLPPWPFMIGTLGAVIRLSHVPSREKNFDIGIAGPLAGFALALGFMIYGYATLPGPEYIFQVHPEYEQFGANYAEHVYNPEFLAAQGGGDIVINKNLLFLIFDSFVDEARVPNEHELMHYPILLAAYLSLIFTAMNLFPIGQLDGGHVIYGLFGRRIHRVIASVALCLFLFYSGLGLLPPGVDELNVLGFFPVPHFVGVAVIIGFYFMCLRGLRLEWKPTLMYAILIFAAQYALNLVFPDAQGFPGWLLFAFLLGRFVTVLHPGAAIETPISTGRKILGWIALIVFVLCFSPNPVQIFINGQ